MEGWKQFLEERERRQLLRRLVPSSGRAPALAVRDGREYVDFSSNDYLGLSSHPALIAAAREALDRYGVGAGASRLMSGDLAIHHELEEETAAFKGSAAALVFNSGYQANTGIVPALFGRREAVFADQLCHARPPLPPPRPRPPPARTRPWRGLRRPSTGNGAGGRRQGAWRGGRGPRPC